MDGWKHFKLYETLILESIFESKNYAVIVESIEK
jgi:hypothetical protein